MTDKVEPDKTPSFEQQVNTAADQMVKNDKGSWELPADTEATEEVKYAAKLERRRKDTQASFTQSKQETSRLKTVNSKLSTHLVDNVTAHLNTEQQDELDELKINDPDAWRTKINDYEVEAQTVLKKQMDEYNVAGDFASEEEARTAAMVEFSTRTGIELNDDIVDNQLPASYSKQLSNGTITFTQFLDKAQEFLQKEKVVQGADEKPDNDKNLGDMSGGSKPSENAKSGDIVQSYAKEIF